MNAYEKREVARILFDLHDLQERLLSLWFLIDERLDDKDNPRLEREFMRVSLAHDLVRNATFALFHDASMKIAFNIGLAEIAEIAP